MLIQILRWKKFSLFLFLLYLPVVSFATEPAYLTSLRVQSSPTVSRFMFMLSKKTYGKVKYSQDQHQLTVDFANTRKRFNLPKVNLKNSNVDYITTSELPKDNLRFTFFVHDKVRWTIRFLANDSKEGGARLELEIVSIKEATKPPVENKISRQGLKKLFEKSALGTFAKLSTESKQKPAEQKAEPMPNKTPRTFTIVIDPGHGGHDSGARGVYGLEEKNVVLAVSKLLAREINKQPNMRAVLTREQDVFVPLRQRLRLARKDNADLFVAIHADAYFDNKSNGASVYALSKRGATTEAARWLAKRENYSEIGDVELDALQDRSLQLRSVLIDLAQTTTIRDSLRLGNKILDELDAISMLHFKHVQQAPFVVLKSPDIPSILVETGFISNPSEEKRLSDVKYQEKLAQALSKGIYQYVRTYAVLE